jgi:hypothetical protein
VQADEYFVPNKVIGLVRLNAVDYLDSVLLHKPVFLEVVSSPSSNSLYQVGDWTSSTKPDVDHQPFPLE